MVLVSNSCADLEKSDIQIKTDEQQSPKVEEFESCDKSSPEDKVDEEDVCPICLEGLFLLITGTTTLYTNISGLELKYRIC